MDLKDASVKFGVASEAGQPDSGPVSLVKGGHNDRL